MDDLDDYFMFYSDFGTYPDGLDVPWYKFLMAQYPNSKFILQIRSVNTWLHSRYTHYIKHVFIPDRFVQLSDQGMKRGQSTCEGLDQLHLR